jgi:CheY-like chemotaxis protein
MNDDSASTHPAAAGTLAAQCVRALLDRHDVPRRKHATAVTEILGLSYSQGSRRLSTNASWTLEELRDLAGHYGESLAEMVSLSQADGMVDAKLELGSSSVPCRVARGPAIHKPRSGALVATLVDSDWHVLAAEGKLATQAYDIKRLVVQPSSARSRRIAVLDDHLDSVQLIVAYLKTADFEVEAFTSLDRIGSALAADPFDGYVLDWIIVKGAVQDTVRDLIATIRSRDAQCPIIVLTGQMRSGVADETDIAAVMSKYRVKFFEKPASLPIISAALASSLSLT